MEIYRRYTRIGLIGAFSYYLKVKFIMGGQEVNFNNNYSNHCIQIQITRGLFKLISRENGNYNKI